MQRDWSRGLAALTGVVALALVGAPAQVAVGATGGAAPPGSAAGPTGGAAPGLAPPTASATADRLALGRCPESVSPRRDAADEEAIGPDRSRCGRLSVPLDRSGAVPGRIGLLVRVLRPRGRIEGTVLALAGGPGQAAAPLLDGFAGTLDGALRRRQLVAFDQRGTGLSGRLRCPSLGRARTLRGIGPAVAACARRLGPRRVAYTSAASVQDVEAVRAAVGADRLILYGTSYGTKVALDYAAAYPQRVERLVLDSVVPQSGNDPFQRATFQAVGPALAALCAGGRCPFTPDPGADVAELVRRIAADGRLRGRWFDGRGRGHAIAIDRAMLFNGLLAGDGDPALRAAFPAAARAAVEGDLAPLARLLGAEAGGGGGDGGDEALFIATTCEDGGVPWPAGTPIDARGPASLAELAAVPPAELAPFDAATLRGSGLFDLCRTWPESPIAQATGPLPDVPALLLTGVEDLRTPVSDAQAVAALLPRARLVAVPQTGHSVLGSDFSRCAEPALDAFLAGRPVRDCRVPRRRELPPLAMPPASVAGLRPVAGLPPRVGRTVAAIAATIRDVDEQTRLNLFEALIGGSFGDRRTIAWGGLHGGFADFGDGEGEPFVLRGYEAVPGVALSGGEMNPDAPGRSPYFAARVSGRDAAAGRVRIDGGVLSGRLGGRAIRLRLSTVLGSRGDDRAVAAAALESEGVDSVLAAGALATHGGASALAGAGSPGGHVVAAAAGGVTGTGGDAVPFRVPVVPVPDRWPRVSAR